MDIVTVGSRYQIVIPKKVRMEIRGLKPGARVVVKANSNGTLAITPKLSTQDWLAKYTGVGKKAWKGVNVMEYINKLRDESEQKLKENPH